ncbi:hypothetical protein NMY22_g4125 [Coprinellus aureogranulatus]|nr:hypothetical protein NMY22_g4125 [Coprinellus aureogranulatus]
MASDMASNPFSPSSFASFPIGAHAPSSSVQLILHLRPYRLHRLDPVCIASSVAYIAAKLWLMVAHRVSETTRAGDVTMLRVWNETLLILASATIADLLIFLRNLRTPLALDIARHMEILSRLKAARGEVENAKVTRAIRAMSEAPADISFEHMLEQIAKETIAAEKMKNLEAKRERDTGRAGDSRWLPR